jgi:hypothetical protein
MNTHRSLRRPNIAPRVSLAYKTGVGAQVSLAYGVFYEKPLNNELIYTNSLSYTKAYTLHRELSAHR